MSDDVLTASEMLQVLNRVLSEEAAALRTLVDDEDVDCISRDLRAERLAALEHVMRVVRRMETWEW